MLVGGGHGFLKRSGHHTRSARSDGRRSATTSGPMSRLRDAGSIVAPMSLTGFSMKSERVRSTNSIILRADAYPGTNQMPIREPRNRELFLVPPWPGICLFRPVGAFGSSVGPGLPLYRLLWTKRHSDMRLDIVPLGRSAILISSCEVTDFAGR